MKFTFLGTGTSQGIPVIGCKCEVCKSTSSKDKRLRCSLLVESENTKVLIDIGPDFRQQALKYSINDIDAIVITHEHMDHVSGLDEIRPFNYQMKKAIKVYATIEVQTRLKEQFSYIFNNANYPGVPSVELVTIGKETFTIGDVDFVPISLMHGNLPVLGFRMGGFTYITDANFIREEEKNKIRGSEHLVLNALRREKHHSHFSLKEARDLAMEVGAKHAYFTHISHHLPNHSEISKELNENEAIAYDGMVVN